MNIFILSWIIEQCAQYHCDKHVVKMILETTQLLSTCWHVSDPDSVPDNIYKMTHRHHPCSVWLRQCRENYVWLCHFGLALCKEYGYRYDKKPSDHKCHSMLISLIQNVPPSLPSNGGKITMPRLAMPNDYKCKDPVLSYRTYYVNDKQRMLVWRKRSPPPWVPTSLHHFHYESEIKRYSKILSKLNGRKTKTQTHLDQIESITATINQLKLTLSNL